VRERGRGAAARRPRPIRNRLARRIRRIAILNPLADFGISLYSHELAEGLAAQGVEVDVYGSVQTKPEHLALPRRHRLLPVLGGPLFRQRRTLAGGARPAAAPGEARPAPRRSWLGVPESLRGLLLGWELTLHLKRKRYDLVWTQWPEMSDGVRFWRRCRRFGLRVAHTVHNVLPHEEQPLDRARNGAVYRHASDLFVHSAFSASELGRLFPFTRGKVVVARHGLYNCYSRCPDARAQTRQGLGIGKSETAVLMCGAIRPYKNVDAVLEALRSPATAGAVLILAGEESGYPDPRREDPLGRSRALAEALGVRERVRFVPQFLPMADMAALFEAADTLLLPYTRTFGSGLLLLGMTFSKHIVGTGDGSMDEYVASYPRHTLLGDLRAPGIAAGLAEAIAGDREPGCAGGRPPELEWSRIAAESLLALEQRAPGRAPVPAVS